MFRLNQIFIWSMAFAVIGTTAATLLQLHPFIVLAGGLLPLVYYFFRLQVQAKSGISQTAVDSIYYFGFIVTIASLAASVLSVAFFGIDRDVNLLIAQFGVGLLATGLALVFRMVLIAKMESLNQKDLSETIDDYVQRIDHIVSSVEKSAANFEGLSNSLMERTRRVTEESQAEFQSSMKVSTASFQQQMLAIATQFGQQASTSIQLATASSDEFFTLVRNISLSGHVQDIATQVGAIGSGLKTFSHETTNFTKVAMVDIHNMTKTTSALALEEFTNALNGVITKTSGGLETALAEIGKLNFTEQTAEVKAQLQALSRNLTIYSKKLETAQDKTGELAVNIASDTSNAIKDSLASHMPQVAEAFSNSLQKTIGGIGEQLGNQAQSEITKFMQQLSAGVVAAMQGLKVEIDAIQKMMVDTDIGEAAHSMQEMFDGLAKETELLTGSVQKFSASLTDNSNIHIEQSVSSAMERIVDLWSAHLDKFGLSLEHKLQKLQESITGLENAVDLTGVQTEFNQLSMGISASLRGMDAMRNALEQITNVASQGTESLEGMSFAARGMSEHLSRAQTEFARHALTSPTVIPQPNFAPVA